MLKNVLTVKIYFFSLYILVDIEIYIFFVNIVELYVLTIFKRFLHPYSPVSHLPKGNQVTTGQR